MTLPNAPATSFAGMNRKTLSAVASLCVVAMHMPSNAMAQWGTQTVPLSTPQAIAGYSVATDTEGTIFAAWRSGVAGRDLLAQRTANDGAPSWEPEKLIVSGEPDLRDPQLVLDGSGGAYLGWTARRGSVYVQHLNADGDAAWGSGGLRVTTLESNSQMMMAPDGAGGCYLAWTHFGVDAQPSVRLQRVTRSGMPVVGWPDSGLVVCETNGSQIAPAMMNDDDESVVVVWFDNRAGATEVRGQRVLSTSEGPRMAWDVAGPRLGAATFNPGDLSAISDGLGGAYVAWSYRTTADEQIAAVQRIEPTGSIAGGWTADGLRVSTAPQAQWAPRLLSLGSLGALVTWGQDLDGAYALRLTPAGTPATQWPANGLRLGPATGVIFVRPVATLWSSSLFVAWPSQEFDNVLQRYVDRLRVQRADLETGRVAWPADGILLTPPGHYYGTASALPMPWGAAVCYVDDRLYATAILDDGPVPVSLSLLEATFANGVVNLAGYTSLPPDVIVLVDRREGSEWQERGIARRTARRVAYTDAVETPNRYGYRLRAQHRGQLYLSATVAVDTEPEVPFGVRITPNPSHGILSVTTQMETQPLLVRIVDVAGRNVPCPMSMRRSGHNRILEYDLRGQAPGVYLLVIGTGQQSVARTIVLAR